MTKAYYIPNGTKNIAPLFPTINFEQVAEYYLEVVDNVNAVVATTTLNNVCGCEDDEDIIRIHFLQYPGAIDSVPFKRTKIDHEPKSDAFEKPTQYPLDKSEHAISRFNVKSNDLITAVCTSYNEPEMDWLDELQDSPVAWLESAGIQGQADVFIPIVIEDAKSEKQKEEDRFRYDFTIQFRLSHEKFIIRN